MDGAHMDGAEPSIPSLGSHPDHSEHCVYEHRLMTLDEETLQEEPEGS